MITLNAACARIRRQKIEEHAGNSFLHPDDILKEIPYLAKYKDQQFLFGIYSSASRWTVISVNYLYAAYDGEMAIVRLDTETDKIYKYFSVNAFSSEIHLTDGRRIWMKSPELSSLILNVLQMLQKVPCGTILEN